MKLRLPATSANLGPGFDALALALKLYLEVEAEPAEQMSIEATGRNADICGATENNLLLSTYGETLAAHGRPIVPLRLQVRNEIPLGMGCGSSAAVRLAGVALAAHFGELGWSGERVLAEASRLEGHPDNAAACWLGGFVASAMEGGQVRAISIAAPREWRAVIAMPEEPLGTHASRGFLPEAYTRKDVVENLQRVGLLTTAFATGKAEMMAVAMGDRLHQPYRAEACPLLDRLLPLAGRGGIAGVALSGAGPGVLLLTNSQQAALEAKNLAAQAVQGLGKVELLVAELENEAVRF
ncbi:MAG TPA: homoserine kinase [Acidobacteriaceae bacterium]|nr:homoserine kinase [Acidobacteriaceae bacterium]